ncbi:DMT family transporter [Nitratireductor kimnyeongensis]|uniref:DMT family transporter n=1 Tax=Nitratireductor kimnyeongensis TaxID=430679 RepID=A0ABW0T322_9HYPH|nr:DMT family transporter [Nitratireductor kimnyeongensis]QZZ35189.1 DMT family transporter [Nitratireductor kimnyeongensis]
MSTPSHSSHAKGLALTAFGGMALTIDIPLIRLADGDPWPILMVRSALTVTVALTVWFVWRLFSRNVPPLIPGRVGLVVAALYALSALCFITAVYNTSTANLVFILAFNSMFAALLSWLFLKERPRPVTLAAMGVMMIGVLIIVGGGIGAGNLFGDVMALSAAFLLATAITITRGSGRDMGFAALVAVALPCLVAVIMTARTGYRIEAPWWIVLNGAVIMPISFFCLSNGPKYISGPEVAMFYLLETVLAPVWVWLIFSEVPSRATLIGGTILIVTLVAHSLWQLHSGRKRRLAQGVVRHPL